MVSPQEKVIVVTGANEGIGYHLLDALTDDGYRVAGFDVNTDALSTLAESDPDQVLALECDVTGDEDVERAVETVLAEWGRIDVLVNNAAVFDFDLFADRTLERSRRPRPERRPLRLLRRVRGRAHRTQDVSPTSLKRVSGRTGEGESGPWLTRRPGGARSRI